MGENIFWSLYSAVSSHQCLVSWLLIHNNFFQTKFADVICINRYYGWYKNMGYTNLIPYEFSYDLEQWHNIEKKPMIISEYGAGTIAGFHEVWEQPK